MLWPLERDSKFLPNNLEVRCFVEIAPCLPVVFCERILNADNGVLAGQLLVHVRKLVVSDPFAFKRKNQHPSFTAELSLENVGGVDMMKRVDAREKCFAVRGWILIRDERL